MTKTVLQRIQAIADAPPIPIYAKLATILRKLASDDDPVGKTMTITRLLNGMKPGEQEDVLLTIETLGANEPGGNLTMRTFDSKDSPQAE